jgi:hypothetical protein
MLSALDSSLRSPSMLKHLSLRIESVDEDTKWSRLSIWSEMDSILIRPTCSRLRSVRITVILPTEAQIYVQGDVESVVPHLLPRLYAKVILLVEKPVVTDDMIDPYPLGE